jgi:hypothetical protein
MEEYTNILYKNTNLCLVDDKLKCNNKQEDLDDNKLITLIPNPIFEDLYINDISIGKILNNHNLFLPIQYYCIPKTIEQNCPFESKYIYFIEKINYNLKQFYSNNHDITYIRKLYNKYIITDKTKVFNYALLNDMNSMNKLKNKLSTVHNLYILKIFKDALISLEELQKKRIIHKNIKPSNIYITLKELDITEIDIDKLLESCPQTRLGDFKLAVQFNEDISIDEINTVFEITNYDYRYLPPELYIVNKLYASKLLKFYDYSNYFKLLDINEEFINTNMDFLNYIKSWNTLTSINHQNILDSFKKNWDKVDIFSLGVSFYKIIKNMNKTGIFFMDLNNLIENMININPEKRFNVSQCIEVIDTTLKKIIKTKHITEKINEYYTPDMFVEIVDEELPEKFIPKINKPIQDPIKSTDEFIEPEIDEDEIIRGRLKNDTNINIQNLVKGNRFKEFKGGDDNVQSTIPKELLKTIIGGNKQPDLLKQNIDTHSNTSIENIQNHISEKNPSEISNNSVNSYEKNILKHNLNNKHVFQPNLDNEYQSEYNKEHQPKLDNEYQSEYNQEHQPILNNEYQHEYKSKYQSEYLPEFIYDQSDADTENSDTAYIEEPIEEPIEELTEEPTEKSTEEPIEELTEEPTEKSTEEPIEEPTEEPIEEPTEEPTEKSTEESIEELTEEPTEKSTEEPIEELTEEPIEELTEEPIKELTEEPIEELTEEPIEEPTEKSTEEPIEELTEELTEKSTEEPIEELTEEPIEEPSEERTNEFTSEIVEHKIKLPNGENIFNKLVGGKYINIKKKYNLNNTLLNFDSDSD